MKQEPNPAWFKENWKWFVPASCVGVLVGLLVLIALILGIVFGVIKSSDVYQQAVAAAIAHPLVYEPLGTPIKTEPFITGNIEVNGSSGHAKLTIPLAGPHDKALVYAVATKSAGKWNFSTLVVEIHSTQQRINLLTGR